MLRAENKGKKNQMMVICYDRSQQEAELGEDGEGLPKAAKRLGSFWNRRKTVGALEREADGFGAAVSR